MSQSNTLRTSYVRLDVLIDQLFLCSGLKIIACPIIQIQTGGAPQTLTFDGHARRTVCWHTVKRTTVKLSDDLDARLRHEAARRDTTVAEVTREAIETHLGGGTRRRLIAAKAGRSGRTDTARRIEEIIRQEARRSR